MAQVCNLFYKKTLPLVVGNENNCGVKQLLALLLCRPEQYPETVAAATENWGLLREIVYCCGYRQHWHLCTVIQCQRDQRPVQCLASSSSSTVLPDNTDILALLHSACVTNELYSALQVPRYLQRHAPRFLGQGIWT